MNILLTRLAKPSLSVILGGLLLIVGCSSTQEITRQPGQVQHIVFCWLNEPGNAEAYASLSEASLKLTSIPGVVRVHLGPPLESDRTVVDDSFDLAIIIVLEHQGALQPYLKHSTHIEAVREVLAPLTERILIYDVLEE